MKAIFGNVNVDVTTMDMFFGAYDNSNNFLAPFTIQLTLGTEVTPTTPGANLLATIVSKVLAVSTTNGWSLAAGDIILGGFTPFIPAEITALQAAVPQTPVYSTPTFSGSTTATKLSATRDAAVSYDYDASLNISVLAGQSVTATLKYADDAGITTNVVTVSSQIASISGLLGLANTQTLKVSGRIPANKFRQVTFAVTGSASAPTAIKAAQEVLL